jgi:hypothetical protein
MTVLEFRAAGAASPKRDFRDKERQATTRDDLPIWLVPLSAYDTVAGRTDKIWVQMVGGKPELTPNEVVTVQGLRHMPWARAVRQPNGDFKGEVVDAYRADSITLAAAGRRSAA